MSKQPSTFDRHRFSFRTDNAGNRLVVRPRDLLIKQNPDAIRDIEAALLKTATEIYGSSKDNQDDQDNKAEPYPQLDRSEPVEVRSGFFRYQLSEESPLDLFRAIEGLREAGFTVQPNHTYFVAGTFINPNYVTPNYVTPNYVTPNYVTPNYVTPNYVTSGHGGGAGCCCSGGLADGTELDVSVPPLRARPAPSQEAPKVHSAPDLEVHVLDVVNPTGTITNQTGELVDLATGAQLTITDQSRIDENNDAWCDPGLAHGFFVKSIVEHASQIETKLWQGIGPLGDLDDACLARALRTIAASASKPNKVLNLSLGGYNENDLGGQLIRDAIADLVADGWLIVAAAGNDGSCRPLWPAALPNVVSVGAIDRFDRPAPFTNFGGWVDACALGVQVTAEFPRLDGLPNRYQLTADPKLDTSVFSTGWATWDGTSFAAPFVAGRLAARINAGDTTEQAVDLLIRDPGRQRIPGLGTIVR